ncbi:fimbrillin family protein, partial [Bacteroides rodentium]
MKKKQQHLLRSLAAALLVGAGLVSCSQDDFAVKQQGDPLPPGKYPLELTANLQVTATTRSTVDGDWDGIDRSLSAAIIIGDDFSGKGLLQYDVTPSDDNMSVTLTPTKKMDAVYWNSITETKRVTAIYPFDYPDTPLVREVMTNQSEEEDYQASDYLSGQIYDLTLEKQLKGEANLKFYHQVAKMVVNINKGALVSSANDIASVEIGGKSYFYCKGQYEPPTSGNNGT